MHMRKKTLKEEDRRFYSLVARAAFSNPFSDERTELERRIVDFSGPETAALSEQRIADLLIDLIASRTGKTDRTGGLRMNLYRGIDQQLIRTAILFDVFHCFTSDFDKHIQEQIEAGDKPCPVPFASRIIDRLKKSGFSHEEALRHLAFFFQLRRAYFFIHRGLIGESPSMRKLRLHLWDTVFTSDIRWYEQHLWNRMEDFSTLLLGETGTGKGTAAAAIGRSIFIPFDAKAGCFRESFTRNFVSINLSRFPESIIESELFGHKKGAFTGAIEHFEGVFARCSPHGSIFLDEIGDVSAHVQLKLLEVLQERTFSPVGSHEKLQFRSRVIAATNKPLENLRRGGDMRDDFFYRLCSNKITVPPLRVRIRENPEEFDLLLDYVVQRTIGKPSSGMAKTIRRILNNSVGPDYSWPGNVRELEQAVRSILITRNYGGDTKGETSDRRNILHRAIDNEEAGAYEILSVYCSMLYEKHGTYEAVSQITGLDRRTVKKYLAAMDVWAASRKAHKKNAEK